MPDEQKEWIERIRAVEREYYAARFSVDRALQQVRQDSTILTGDIKVREIQGASEFLEATYIVRLFAEFESGLRRSFWLVRKRRPPNRTEDLLNSIAAKQKIPEEQLLNAHQVREYRNGLVHERDEEIEPLSIKDARSHLCHFLSFLPRHW